jgi:hypothetical protein
LRRRENAVKIVVIFAFSFPLEARIFLSNWCSRVKVPVGGAYSTAFFTNIVADELIQIITLANALSYPYRNKDIAPRKRIIHWSVLYIP